MMAVKSSKKRDIWIFHQQIGRLLDNMQDEDGQQPRIVPDAMYAIVF